MPVVLLLLTLAATPNPQTWTFKTGAHAKVSVSNIAGAISVEGVSGDQVTVEANIVGDADSRWTVDAKSEGENVRVRACCGSCDEEDQHCGPNGSRVEFKLKVPEESALTVKAVSSAISVRGVKGSEKVHSVSGGIEISGSRAPLEVHNVSGAVKLAPQRVAASEVRTVSGDVQIALPASPDAKVTLRTVSGSLNGRHSMGTTETVFGNGTNEIQVKSVSGSVQTDPVSGQ